MRGAGELVERLPDPAPHAVVLLPGGGGLSTARVFAEADALGLGRDPAELEEIADRLREVAGAGASPLTYPTCSSTTSSRRRGRFGPRSATPSTPCAVREPGTRC